MQVFRFDCKINFLLKKEIIFFYKNLFLNEYILEKFIYKLEIYFFINDDTLLCILTCGF
jgi:hypothetical protein